MYRGSERKRLFAALLKQNAVQASPERLTRLLRACRRLSLSLSYVIDILDPIDALAATNKHYFLST